jgi:Domain of unknown function (DUF1707)
MCHHRHRHHHRRPVIREVSDEPRRTNPQLRASDAERESIVAQLRDHGAAGRLEVDELEQRVGAAYAARTHGELDELLADLPARRPGRAVAAPRVRHWPRHEWAGFLQVNALLIALWAVTGAGYFWPAWVMVWWAFALVMKSGPNLLRLR